jgi:succinate dehydrogenase/fumarate reductase flavoprotein subunit
MNDVITRRSLLAGTAGAALAGSALTASGSAQAAKPKRRWDHEVDVLVVGFGLAACSAAIEAIDTDPKAKVLMLEKADEMNAGGDTRASGQGLVVPKDKQAMMRYHRNMYWPNPIPDDLLEFYVDELMVLHPWIEARAKEANQPYIQLFAIYEFPELGAVDAVLRQATILPRAGGLWEAFKKNVLRRPIDVWYESPATDLIQDPDTGEVLGAVVNRKGKEVRVRARRGVVMACGGYAASPEILANYCGYYDSPPAGSPYNTGDGIYMLQKVGADLWHMRNRMYSGGFHLAIQVPEFKSAFLVPPSISTRDGWIEIAADNKRFYDESLPYGLTHYKVRRHGNYFDTMHQWVGPVHRIMDETVLKTGGPLVGEHGWNNVVHGYRWSKDNSVEIEKGWLIKADTVAELAVKMGRDPKQVEETVAEWNKSCEAGHDPLFNRDPRTLRPLKPPFYAVQIKPIMICTSGGAKRNRNSEVLDRHGKPIPGLYEAGQLGSMISFLYQNGTYLTEAMISGRSAGRNAVKRT